jgi:hypothetical protein
MSLAEFGIRTTIKVIRSIIVEVTSPAPAPAPDAKAPAPAPDAKAPAPAPDAKAPAPAPDAKAPESDVEPPDEWIQRAKDLNYILRV